MPTQENPSLLVAVDTNVVMELAADVDDVWDSIDTIRKRVPQCEIVVTPSVFQEMVHLCENGETKQQREFACTALEKLHFEWRFRLIDFVPVGHGIVERIADRIRNQDLLPNEEVNDSLILAEAALLGCGLLLTSDPHLRGIDHERLNLLLTACDVGVPVISTPRQIVRKFFR